MATFKTSKRAYFPVFFCGLQSYIFFFFQVHLGSRRVTVCLLSYLSRSSACGVFVEKSLTLAVCWSEQFQAQRINLPKILQGSQGPSDPPEDGWWRVQWERSIRQGRGGCSSRDVLITVFGLKLHFGNMFLYNVTHFIENIWTLYPFRTETKGGNSGNGQEGFGGDGGGGLLGGCYHELMQQHDKRLKESDGDQQKHQHQYPYLNVSIRVDDKLLSAISNNHNCCA